MCPKMKIYLNVMKNSQNDDSKAWELAKEIFKFYCENPAYEQPCWLGHTFNKSRYEKAFKKFEHHAKQHKEDQNIIGRKCFWKG